MSHVITKRSRISRRRLLKGVSLSGGAWLGLPPLVSMFNAAGTAYAAKPGAAGKLAEAPIESRFVIWFKRQRNPGALLDSRGDRRQL
jgi:hypothetical protein